MNTIVHQTFTNPTNMPTSALEKLNYNRARVEAVAHYLRRFDRVGFVLIDDASFLVLPEEIKGIDFSKPQDGKVVKKFMKKYFPAELQTATVVYPHDLFKDRRFLIVSQDAIEALTSSALEFYVISKIRTLTDENYSNYDDFDIELIRELNAQDAIAQILQAWLMLNGNNTEGADEYKRLLAVLKTPPVL